MVVMPQQMNGIPWEGIGMGHGVARCPNDEEAGPGVAPNPPTLCVCLSLRLWLLLSLWLGLDG